MSVKELALEVIRVMPDGVTWDELLSELEILADLRRADAEIDAGDLLECSGLTEPSILSGTTACLNSGRHRDETAKTAALPANTHGGHG